MQVLDDEKWKQKLQDARRTGKLNISYFNLPEITAAQIEDIKVRTRRTPLDDRQGALYGRKTSLLTPNRAPGRRSAVSAGATPSRL